VSPEQAPTAPCPAEGASLQDTCATDTCVHVTQVVCCNQLVGKVSGERASEQE